ncbi:rod shape-determining protein MreD [Novosphingobium lentum]|uniref:rod shape-determining protein MreD n=1 Tax=Novosphingobium lentum TaxID=145287 RepID=UPI000833D809|nr:rod shape-determining protein MreD [Novosphingobium lentum]
MSRLRLPARAEDRFRSRINRAPSPVLAVAVPWASIMLLSMISFSPIVASAPVLPPLAFMLLIAWRMLRPGLLPVWAGLPLGAFDDLYSGQPFGSGIVLWSLAMLAMDVIDVRFLWRGFLQDWLAAAALFAGYLLLGALIAGMATGHPDPIGTLPQVALSIVLFPAINALVALLDRLRLLPLKTVGA